MGEPDFRGTFATGLLFRPQHDTGGDVVVAKIVDQGHCLRVPLQRRLAGFLCPVGRATPRHQLLRDDIDDVLGYEGVALFLSVPDNRFSGHSPSKFRGP